ncbi:MAG: hypothetical protein QHJ34_13250 [bacterium]|jgi:4-hydroxy-L-threonine phosphate dehydrogenase PdxA|nr:hypothetical protein [candidate division KSB1 bacterium]MDH7561179.1 hypothetical protein [bacterium]
MAVPEGRLPRVVLAVGNAAVPHAAAVLRAVVDPPVSTVCRTTLAGDFQALSAAAHQLGLKRSLRRVGLLEQEADEEDAVCVIDRPKHPLVPRAQEEMARVGERMLEDLDAALQVLLFGWADAVVVTQLAMPALRAAGFHYADIGRLLGEWLRLEGRVRLRRVPERPLVRVVGGTPAPIVLATPGAKPSPEELFLSLKESLQVAATLVNAKA